MSTDDTKTAKPFRPDYLGPCDEFPEDSLPRRPSEEKEGTRLVTRVMQLKRE